MPETPDTPEKSEEERAQAASDLSTLVQKAIIEAAALRDIEERVTEVSTKISKLTPPPEKPTEDAPSEPPP